MKLPYSEGSVFLLPLCESGYARGVVARSAPKGKILFGYFFGPRLLTLADANLAGIKPHESVLQLRFGDLGLIDGSWSIIGKIEDWHKNEWPMPKFVRREPLGRLKPIIIEYSDHDPSAIVSERFSDQEVNFQIDSLSGYRAVEIKLDKILK